MVLPSRRTVCLGIAVLGVAGCSHRIIEAAQQYPIPPNAQALPPERLERVMLEAASKRGWRFDRRGPGDLLGTLTRRGYSVWVNLRFTQTSYSFVFEPSAVLASLGQEVEREYQRWIYYMKADIDEHLRSARA